MFIRLSNEEDFLKALSREATDIDGVPYRGFHWYPDFNEDREPSLVLVIWVVVLYEKYYISNWKVFATR